MPTAKTDDPAALEAGRVVNPVTGTVALGFPWQTRDPFLFCVHHDDDFPEGNERLGPKASLAGRQLGMDFEIRDGWRMYHGRVVPGFPQHPHRGFETVTFTRTGLIDHSDSLGAAARYGEGDAQWLTAGKGILHAEMMPLLKQDARNRLDFFQIWLNLPARRKMVDPHFTMIWADEVPELKATDAAGRQTYVRMVGSDTKPPPDSWAAEPNAEVAIWDIRMEAGAQWLLPAGSAGLNRSLYFFRGRDLKIGSADAPLGHRIDIEPDVAVTLRAGAEPVEVLMLQGRPIGEPVVKHGPFVMNSRQEIQQAFQDYQRTRFGGWPWPSNDHVHGRAEGRFARHADGRKESPT